MASRQDIRFCSSHDGVRLAWARSGRGPALVKVSNWMTHVEFDWESPVWKPWLTLLSRHYTLVRYDERGCGLSDWNAGELSFDAWVRDLETVVDAAGLERFALLGMSQGASLAVRYAVTHPERVSRLVIVGGYARGRRRRDAGHEDEAETLARLAEIGWGQDNPAFRQFFTTLFIPGGTPAQHEWFNELERISTSPANAAQFMRVFHEIDVTDVLQQVQCPTLVMHSTRDARVPFDEGRLIAGMIPGARFVPLDSDNHVLLDDEPAWKRMFGELTAFLSGSGGPPGAFADLTTREREILELIAQGRDNAQVAASLDMAEKTVRNHITRIFDKLEVDNRARAIVLAREAGFGNRAAGDPG